MLPRLNGIILRRSSSCTGPTECNINLPRFSYHKECLDTQSLTFLQSYVDYPLLCSSELEELVMDVSRIKVFLGYIFDRNKVHLCSFEVWTGHSSIDYIFFVLCAALALISAKSDIGNQQSDLRQELVHTGDVAPAAEPLPEAPAETK